MDAESRTKDKERTPYPGAWSQLPAYFFSYAVNLVELDFSQTGKTNEPKAFLSRYFSTSAIGRPTALF